MSFSELQALVQQLGSNLELRTLLAAISKLESAPDASRLQKIDLLKELLQLVEPQLQQCQPRGLGEVMRVCGKLGYGPARLYNICLDAFVSKRHEADAQALANVVCAVAKAPDHSIKQQWGPIVQQQLLPRFIGCPGTTSPQEVAMMIWGVATMRLQLPAEQLQQLLAEFIDLQGTSTTKNIANVIWGVATMGQQVPAEQLKELLSGFISKLSTAAPQGIANVIWGVAKIEQQVSAEQLQHLLAGFIGNLDTAKAQEIANVIYGMAVMGQQVPAEQLQQLLAGFIGKISTDTPQGIANVIWGVRTMGQQLPAEQLQQLLAGFIGKLSTATPQEIANVIWGVAKIEQQVPAEQLQQLLAGFLSKLSTATPQNIANVIAGLANMGQQLPAEQLQQLVSGLLHVLGVAIPKDISKVIWSVATMGQQLLTGQLKELLIEFIGKLSTATPQNIANVIWGVATMGQQLPAEQLQQLLSGFVGNLGTAKPQEISMAILGVAKMCQEQVSTIQLQQLMVALTVKLPSASPQAVAISMWGLAHLQPQPFFPAPLLESKAKQTIVRMVADMIPQNLANIAWACGIWGHGDEQLLLPLFKRVEDNSLVLRGQYLPSVQNLTNMCWAAAVLNMQQLVSHVEQFAAAISSRWEDVFAKEKQQLHQVHMWLLDLNSSSRGLLGCLSEQQLKECREPWQKQIAEMAVSAKTSPAHRSVLEAAAMLPGLSQPPQLEAVTADSLHSIDVLVVTKAGVPVAILVDGRHRFRQPDLQPTGTTQWRNRSLAARGYVVVSVPYWEWNQLPGADRVGYLEAKIQQGLAGASGGVVPDAGAAAPAS
jgi:hypothetical protein